MDVLRAASTMGDRLGLRRRWSRSEWTDLVKADLTKLGHELGFEVNGCRRHEEREKAADWSEWVWDLTWVDYDKVNNVTLDLPLIVESEWTDDLGVDFEKLKVGRARHRLMIFRAKDSVAVNQKIQYLKELVRMYRGGATGDRYLFAGFSTQTSDVHFDLFVDPRCV